jgi:hypothetical protein
VAKQLAYGVAAAIILAGAIALLIGGKPLWAGGIVLAGVALVGGAYLFDTDDVEV